jgi:hypothetical protein
LKKAEQRQIFPGKRRAFCGEKSGGRKSGNLREPICAGTLREKECGDTPHYFSWGFFIAQINFGARNVAANARQMLRQMNARV